jgi:hypothetical protein
MTWYVQAGLLLFGLGALFFVMWLIASFFEVRRRRGHIFFCELFLCGARLKQFQPRCRCGARLHEYWIKNCPGEYERHLQLQDSAESPDASTPTVTTSSKSTSGIVG